MPRKAITAFILSLPGLIWGCSKDTGTTYPTTGDRLPSFTITINDGSTVTSEHLTETDCILVFFNTGCPDCRRELPVIDDFARLHPETETYAVSREQGQKDIEKYWQENGLTLKFSAQTDRSIYNLFTASGIPHTVVSRKGTITAIFTDTDNLTTETLETILHPEDLP